MFKSWMIQTLLSLLILLDQAIAQALRNVTVDDTDPRISYVGNWEGGASQFDFGGSHTVSEDPTASAAFNFTGAAVYYLAPKWPYIVDSYVSLDGRAPVFVNITTPPGEDTLQSAPLWSATGLSNGPHRLVVTRGPSQYAFVDGFIYTTQSADNTTTSTTSGTAASSGGLSGTPLIIVLVGSVVATLVLLFILFKCCPSGDDETTDVAYHHSTELELGPTDEPETIYIPDQQENIHNGTYTATVTVTVHTT